jgi:hypothetical protein
VLFRFGCIKGVPSDSLIWIGTVDEALFHKILGWIPCVSSCLLLYNPRVFPSIKGQVGGGDEVKLRLEHTEVKKERWTLEIRSVN